MYYSIDFETYSESGYIFDGRKWGPCPGAKTSKGLQAVGAAKYAEDPSTEIISMAWNENLWLPGSTSDLSPLFGHIIAGGIISAWNSFFEFNIWNRLAVPRYGWPPLKLEQMRDPMACAKSYSIPPSLSEAGAVLGVDETKDKAGESLIRFFSIPRAPTKLNPDLRNRPDNYPEKAIEFARYNLQDVKAERAITELCPPLSATDLSIWIVDQTINNRGVFINKPALEKLKAIVEGARGRSNKRLYEITRGSVPEYTKLTDLSKFLASRGLHMESMDRDRIDAALERDDLDPVCREALKIRSDCNSTSVDKLYAIDRRICKDGRIRGLFDFRGAQRTGRWAGRGPQPQNLKWSISDPSLVIDADPETLNDPIESVSGCLRSLFCAAPGKDLICSDYSAIEAVVLAELAGESWRQEVFRTHGKIYEMSASKITGVPFDDFLKHKRETGEHHPLRKKIGKVAELASGYQGWIGAWKNFGADKHFASDDEIKNAIIKWRQENPNIVKMWGGQLGYEPDGIEGAVIKAILNPGESYRYRSITYRVDPSVNVLFCVLPSGRKLCYHNPRLVPVKHKYYDRMVYKIHFMGTHAITKKWVEQETYGGKLVENIVQAVSCDILANALVNCERNGYPVVLHVHDEIVCEVDEGRGSIEELEAIMGDLPEWCEDWPVKAAGGWRGKYYRKD